MLSNDHWYYCQACSGAGKPEGVGRVMGGREWEKRGREKSEGESKGKEIKTGEKGLEMGGEGKDMRSVPANKNV